MRKIRWMSIDKFPWQRNIDPSVKHESMSVWIRMCEQFAIDKWCLDGMEYKQFLRSLDENRMVGWSMKYQSSDITYDFDHMRMAKTKDGKILGIIAPYDGKKVDEMLKRFADDGIGFKGYNPGPYYYNCGSNTTYILFKEGD